MDLVSICGQSFFEAPVSGGDFLNFELLRNLSNAKNVYLVINDITFSYARENLKCNILPIKDFFNLNKIVQEHIFLVPLAFFNSFLKTIKILKRFKEPLILYSSGDFICNILPMVIYKKKFPQSKIIIKIHHLNENPLKRKGNSFFSSIFSFFLQRISLLLIKKNVDLVLLLNKGVKNTLMQIGFPSEKLVVIGSGIDLIKIKLKNGTKRENKIIFLGRLSRTKGIFDLPKIMPIVLQQLPDAKLIIIGVGHKKIINNIKREFYKSGILANIDFRGYIKAKNEIYDIMNEGRIFILPSYEEGWGIVVFEAIACGLAPVVYEIPIFNEILDGSISKVTLGDFSAFAQKIINFLKDEKAREEYNFLLREKIKPCNLSNVIGREIELIERISNIN